MYTNHFEKCYTGHLSNEMVKGFKFQFKDGI